jgi:hypothetical protein
MITEWLCSFEDRPPEITEPDLRRAVALYFTRKEESVLNKDGVCTANESK